MIPRPGDQGASPNVVVIDEGGWRIPGPALFVAVVVYAALCQLTGLSITPR